MVEKEIGDFKTFHSLVQRYDTSRHIFRGVHDSKYKLLPKLGRLRLRKNMEFDELEMLRLFKDHATPYLPNRTISEWELLAIAQHHGLPTRLLDWSRNALVAAFFAVEQESKKDSAVYVLKDMKFVDIKHLDPFKDVDEVMKFIPPHITTRITAQSGLFTIHPKPNVPFRSESVDKLVIRQNFRRDLKKMLYRYGVHRAALFPGLDGIANYIQWLRTDSH
jgi:FRG domain